MTEIKLTASWSLIEIQNLSPSSSTYEWALMRRKSDLETYSPDEIVTPYVSWGPMRARDAVRRMGKTCEDQSAESQDVIAQFCGPGRPSTDGTPAESWLQVRLTRERKGAYVKAAKARKLSEWVTGHLDKAAGYEPGN